MYYQIQNMSVRWSVITAVVWFSICGTAVAEPVDINVSTGMPYMLQGQRQTTFIKIGIRGVPIDESGYRTPVNVAIVLDRSGSMANEKLKKAKEAAVMAIERLDPEDIVSVIAYNHTVTVLVPATKVRDRAGIYAQINALDADGYTALFAGVSKGAFELRKFIDRNRVNRIVLLSDGLANVGPSSPGELGELGQSLAREAISVTTIGLGDAYNEDLMVALSSQSDGNHAFAETASDLARIFSAEFGDITSVVASDVHVRVQCGSGIRPIRTLGRHAQIAGLTVETTINQIYAKQEKFLLLEVEVPANRAGNDLALADVTVQYADPRSKSVGVFNRQANVHFTESAATVEQNRDRDVMVSSVELVANEANKNALRLRDKGQVNEAKRVLDDNAAFLDRAAKQYKAPALAKRAARSRKAQKNLDSAKWNVQRKRMRSEQNALDMQQLWE